MPATHASPAWETDRLALKTIDQRGTIARDYKSLAREFITLFNLWLLAQAKMIHFVLK